MKEYEYSYKVKDIKPFLEFCKDNKYEKINILEQKRILYKNKKNILARITINNISGNEEKYFNFKEENESNETLKISEESPEIKVTDENEEFIKFILKKFEFEKSIELDRTRYIYKQYNVKFEIDDYKYPKMKVVAIEGKKEEVDMVNEQLENILIEYKEK